MRTLYCIMSMDFEKIMAGYDYSFPPAAIAQAPVTPRDSARLLVYDRGRDQVRFDLFRALADYLPAGALLVLNDTKVMPARVSLTRATGGRVDILYVASTATSVLALASKKLSAGAELFDGSTLLFTVTGHDGTHYLLKPAFRLEQIPTLLEQRGTMPLPPYIKHSPLSEAQLREQYQTVFARQPGSVAAPTASLHFTPELLAQLPQHGFSVAYVTLHVGLGTFATLTPANLAQQKLHAEYYTVSPQAANLITQAHAKKTPIIPVGTTALRAVESAVNPAEIVQAGAGRTSLFIQPGYDFKIATGLITNFHVPRSSLMMLAAALVGREKLLALYQQAITRHFRLFSFGDAMLIT